MENQAGKERMLHYDLLRILAAFSVVMLHSSAQCWYSLDVYGAEWKIANFYNAMSRFGVPVFVMLSGALFLSRPELNLKKLYTHNILRLLLVFALWSCLYGLLDSSQFDFSQVGWKEVVKEMVMGRYHLWFLPMLAGIYMIMPILHTWVRNVGRRSLEYFLALFFVMQILTWTLKAVNPSPFLSHVLDLFQMNLACSYVGYFVLGYYVAHIRIPQKYHKFIYISVIPAAVLNFVISNCLSEADGIPRAEIYDSYGLFTFCIVLAVFLFFTETAGKLQYSERAVRLIREVSGGTLGVYLMHLGVMEILERHGIHSMTLPILVGIPAYALFCFTVCLAVSAALRRVPFLGRYIC